MDKTALLTHSKEPNRVKSVAANGSNVEPKSEKKIVLDLKIVDGKFKNLN